MISAILLSGGFGKRMQSDLPKQYLPFHGKPVILHALEALLTFPLWKEIAIVCEPQYISLFAPYKTQVPLHFCLPGQERQDSVQAGFQCLSPSTRWVCIHDGARPLLQKKDLYAVLEAGQKHGASALAIPVHGTIKEADASFHVVQTLDRSRLWEMQTPQVLSYDLLQKGLQRMKEKGQKATDDLSLAESVDHPATIVPGDPSNIKITTSVDFLLGELLFKRMYG